MRRYLYLAACVLMLALGLLFGGLNDAAVQIDLWFVQWQANLGSALLAAGLLGAVLGGACLWLVVILPLQSRLRRAERTVARTTAMAVTEQDVA